MGGTIRCDSVLGSIFNRDSVFSVVVIKVADVVVVGGAGGDWFVCSLDGTGTGTGTERVAALVA